MSSYSHRIRRQRALCAYQALRKQAEAALAEYAKLRFFGLDYDAAEMRVHHARLSLRLRRIATLAGISILFALGACTGHVQQDPPEPGPMWTHHDLEAAVQGAWLSRYPGEFPYGELAYAPASGPGIAVLAGVGRDVECIVYADGCIPAVRGLLECAQLYNGRTVDDNELALLVDAASWPCERERDVSRLRAVAGPPRPQ